MNEGMAERMKEGEKRRFDQPSFTTTKDSQLSNFSINYVPYRIDVSSWTTHGRQRN
jgi:hypothetical protein